MDPRPDQATTGEARPATSDAALTGATALRRLRTTARREGLLIRSRRTGDTERERVYSVIDHATGEMIHSEIVDLDDVKDRIERIVRERQPELERASQSEPEGQTERAGQPEPERQPELEHPGQRDRPSQPDLPGHHCPRCATRRVGWFRFCRACGLDFELADHQRPSPSVLATAPAKPVPLPNQAMTSAPNSAPAGRFVPSSAPDDRIGVLTQVIAGGVVGLLSALITVVVAGLFHR